MGNSFGLHHLGSQQTIPTTSVTDFMVRSTSHSLWWWSVDTPGHTPGGLSIARVAEQESTCRL